MRLLLGEVFPHLFCRQKAGSRVTNLLLSALGLTVFVASPSGTHYVIILQQIAIARAQQTLLPRLAMKEKCLFV
jgi:hypothetical protein